MSWFQLDPSSIAERARTGGAPPTVPSLSASVGRGVVGFTIVSVAGFAPWALGGRWLHRAAGEAGMYAACAIVFIGLSGLLLHRLIIGPGSLGRFYKVFSIAFAAYAAAWMGGWMSLHGHAGSLVGLLAGTAIMGWLLAKAFDATSETSRVIVVLFVFNSLGYFLGGWVEGRMSALKELSFFGMALARSARLKIAMLSWGVCYGIGFGAGLGWAFYLCQSCARSLLMEPQRPEGAARDHVNPSL